MKSLGENKMYPDWVEKHHTRGTSIKVISGAYYLYGVTSKRVAGKKYPVSIQKYIGRITKNGLIKPEKITFIPEVDSIVILSDIINIDDEKDKTTLSKVGVIRIGDIYYCGNISSKIIKVIKKYFHYSEGKIWN